MNGTKLRRGLVSAGKPTSNTTTLLQASSGVADRRSLPGLAAKFSNGFSGAPARETSTATLAAAAVSEELPETHSSRRAAEHPAAPRVELELPEREQLYQEFRPLVTRLLHQFGKTPELRQDLEGEIYCRFCRLLADYDPSRGIPLRPYMVRMLQQTTFNYVRDYWRYENRCVSLQQEEDAGHSLVAEESGADWLQRLAGQEVREALPAMIAKLPSRQRMVLVWRFYDDRSFEEIATQLRIRPATARSLLRHAIGALRRHLEVAGYLGK